MPSPIHCILLIDDDPDDNFLHQIVIRDSGLCEQIRVSENGIQALNYLTGVHHPGYIRPDIILLDINMPGMNGFEFLGEYDKLPKEQKAKVVLMMLTTSLNPDDHKRAMSYGIVDSFKSKPLTRKLLEDVVNTHFQ
nr:response regulator [uncultured Arsenicibacter sp.]